MTMITPSYLGETIEYSSLHACRSTLEDPTTPPGSAVSGGISKMNGAAIRRLRRMSMRTGNTSAIWDNVGAVPSTADPHPKKMPSPVKYFYKKIQYSGSVDYGKRNKQQPVPQSLDILRQDGRGLSQSVGGRGETP